MKILNVEAKKGDIIYVKAKRGLVKGLSSEKEIVGFLKKRDSSFLGNRVFIELHQEIGEEARIRIYVDEIQEIKVLKV